MTEPLEPPHKSAPPPASHLALRTQLAVIALCFLVFGLSLSYLSPHPDVTAGSLAAWNGFDNPWLDAYPRWDGGWYKQIATEGYYFSATEESPIPFFPLYPLLMRGMATLDWMAAAPPVGHHVDTRAALRAGIAINLIAGLLAVVLLLRWTAAWFGQRTAVLTATTFSCYPLVYYTCGPVYAEPLFLLLAMGAFYALERDRIWSAALLGALASATRPVGVALCIGLAFGALERSKVIQRREGAGVLRSLIPRVSLANFRWGDVRIFLCAAGGFAYWCYLFSFADVAGVPGYKVYTAACAAPGWGMDPGPAVWLKFEAWTQLSSWPYRGKQVLILFHMTLTLLAFASVPIIVRRMGWGLGTFVGFALLIPALSSKDFIAMGRYVLPCFPCFALAGEFLGTRPTWQRVAVWGAGLLMMCVLASRFCRWYYVS